MAIQDLAGNYGLLPDYVDQPTPGIPLGGQGLRTQVTPIPPDAAEPPMVAPMSAPMAPPVALPAAEPELPQIARAPTPTLTDLGEKYAGRYANSTYGPELRQAARRVESEQAAFDALIQKTLAEPTEKPSQAELYFRLAAAFGTPTKTGNFFESLGVVGKEVSDYLKENRATESASRANKLKTLLESRKISLTAARDELNALRTLAVDEIKTAGPQSPAGKQAQDEGLKPGTPEFIKRVTEIAQTGVDAKMAQINATLTGLQLREKEAKKLTPGEVKLKSETEDIVAAGDSAMRMLSRAYEINPKTFDTSLVDSIQRKALEAAGSKDAKLLATREMENLLGEQAISKLKASFGGNPTEGERKILLDLQGIGAKSVEERAAILRNAYQTLKESRARHQRRLDAINRGEYRSTGEQAPDEGGLQ